MAGDPVRTDKWLWAVRLFKSRGEAARACEGGRVRSGGRVMKAATPLKGGEVIELPYAEGPGTRVVRVLGLIERRVGPPLAALACEDLTPPEVLGMRQEWGRNRSLRQEGEQGRPTKRKRRQMDRQGGFFE